MWPIYLFIFGYAVSLLLRRLFSSCNERGLLLAVVFGLLIAVASLVAEHGLQGARASVAVMLGLSSCGLYALECRLSSCGAWG